MSDTNNSQVQTNYSQGRFTSETAQNTGAAQAQNGGGCSPQQHNESAALFNDRVNAFNSAKQSG